jgi:hypothetical protein
MVMIAPNVTRYPTGDIDIQFPFDRSFVELLKMRIPSRHRAWDPSTKTWYVDPSYASLGIRLLRDWFGYVEVEQAEGWRRGVSPPPPPQPIRQKDQDFAVLHLLPSALPALIEASFKCLSKELHPGRGGSHEAMIERNQAVSALRVRQGVA